MEISKIFHSKRVRVSLVFVHNEVDINSYMNAQLTQEFFVTIAYLINQSLVNI